MHSTLCTLKHVSTRPTLPKIHSPSQTNDPSFYETGSNYLVFTLFQNLRLIDYLAKIKQTILGSRNQPLVTILSPDGTTFFVS